MSSNTNTNNPYQGATGSGFTSGAGEHAGSRDNTHDGYGGNNTFSDNRGMSTSSEISGRSDPAVTKSGMGAGSYNAHGTYDARYAFNGQRGVDMKSSESSGRSDSRVTKSGAGAGNEITQPHRAEQLNINATTNQQYGYQTGSGYYDPSRMNGSGFTSSAGSRDNAHDGYTGSNTFTDDRGMSTTNSDSIYGRSDPSVTKLGMGAGGDSTHGTFDARHTFHDQRGVDMKSSESSGRSDSRVTKSGVGAGNEITQPRRAEQLNATTNQQYGHQTASGYYDPSRMNTSASSATGGMPGTGAELRNATTTTGSNVGQGIHASGYYDTGMSTGVSTTTMGSRTGMGDTSHGVSGQHQHPGHHTHSQHHHESLTDKERCTTCQMVAERAKQMGSMGQTTTTSTTSRTVPKSGTSAGNTAQHTGAHTTSGTNMPSSVSQSTGLNEKGETVVHEGPSPMHLRPGEAVVERETRVHRVVAPGEKSSTRKTSNSGMGMGDSGRTTTGSTAMGATSAGMGHGTAMGASTGLAGGVGGAGAGAGATEAGAGGGSKGVSMTDKMMGGAEKLAGKVTSNEEMMRRGEEKLAGATASSKN